VAAGYLQAEWAVSDSFRITGGLRVDHYTDFGATANPRLALVYRPSSKYYLKALYGRAFRAPTYRELYARNNPVVVGDEDNDPEVIQTMEALVGVSLSDSVVASIGTFYSHIDDVILPQDDPTGPDAFRNQAETKTHGIELAWDQGIAESIRATANFTWVDGETKLADGSRVDLPLAARYRANVVLTGDFLDALLVSTSLRYTDGRRRDSSTGDPRKDIDPDLVLDVFAKVHDLFEGVSVYAKLSNVFDTDLRTPSTFPAKATAVSPSDIPGAGRTFSIGVMAEY